MSKRILYVEDHPQNMLLIQRIVEAEGHHFLAATNGEAGWETAVQEQPDLIIMDLHLPGRISGMALTRRIKQQKELRRIPIIALTAYDTPEVERLARAAGCDAFLRKPADIRQIRTVLHRFLDTSSSSPSSSYTFI